MNALPEPGFNVEPRKRGPDRVEVGFEGRDDENDQESRVRASCVGAVPVFEADED